jgi:hypothetical protein
MVSAVCRLSALAKLGGGSITIADADIAAGRLGTNKADSTPLWANENAPAAIRPAVKAADR